MEDVVAVEVQLVGGGSRYVITWGRIQDEVDPTQLEALVLAHSRRLDLGGTAERARVCFSLREAADSGSAPYFYEGLLDFAHRPIPFGAGYEHWRAERAAAMAADREIYYCGKPNEPS
jgi:hypothetical protein